MLLVIFLLRTISSNIGNFCSFSIAEDTLSHHSGLGLVCVGQCTVDRSLLYPGPSSVRSFLLILS